MAYAFRFLLAVCWFLPGAAMSGCTDDAPRVIEEPEEGAFEALAAEAAAEEESTTEP